MKQTVASVAMERVGVRKGIGVLSFVVEWWMVEDATGFGGVHGARDVEAFADWWKCSRAQAFRRQQIFREAFPEFSTPSDLRSALVAHQVELPSLSGNVETDLVSLVTLPYVVA